MNCPAKRALLVEDNADNAYLVTVLLRSEGFHVDVARTGTDALQYAAGEPYAFVLLDLELPDVDGFEVARQLRGAHTPHELPIIAVSAFASGAERRRAFAAGCTGFLEKPIKADSFVAQVRCLAGVMVE